MRDRKILPGRQPSIISLQPIKPDSLFSGVGLLFSTADQLFCSREATELLGWPSSKALIGGFVMNGDEYRYRKRLGEGANANVFSVQGKPGIVVKQLVKQVDVDTSSDAFYDMAEEIKDEIRCHGLLGKKVNVFHYPVKDETSMGNRYQFFLVMPDLGYNLAIHLYNISFKDNPAETVFVKSQLRLFSQIASQLKKLSDHGIYPFDLKTWNVMVKNQKASLIDFAGVIDQLNYKFTYTMTESDFDRHVLDYVDQYLLNKDRFSAKDAVDLQKVVVHLFKKMVDAWIDVSLSTADQFLKDVLTKLSKELGEILSDEKTVQSPWAAVLAAIKKCHAGVCQIELLELAANALSTGSVNQGSTSERSSSRVNLWAETRRRRYKVSQSPQPTPPVVVKPSRARCCVIC